MRLLVSVRSAAEVGAALDGRRRHHRCQGAGPRLARRRRRRDARRDRWRRCRRRCRFSVALGDFTSAKDVVTAVGAVELPARAGRRLYLKLGFAGARSARVVIRADADRRGGSAAAGNEPPQVVAVAYADAAGSDAPDP